MAVMSHRGLKLGDHRRVLAAVTKTAVSNLGALQIPGHRPWGSKGAGAR